MELIVLLLCLLVALAGGYLATNRAMMRLSRLQRETEATAQKLRRQSVVTNVLSELRDNMGLAQGEFRTGMSTEPLVPAGFVTAGWEAHRGDLMDLGDDSYEALRGAYGAIYHANSVRDFILYASSRTFGKSTVADYIDLHRGVLKEKVIPALYKAIDGIEAEG